MSNYIDLGRLSTGFIQGVSIANMFDEQRQNKILEARQNMLWERQQREFEMQQENLMQMQKSEELMQQKMQESYDQNSGRIDLKKISEMYGYVKPEIFQKYSQIAAQHNQAFDEYDRDKVQDQIDYNKLAASNLQNQKMVFDTFAGKLQGSLNNPIKWQNNIAIARQNGLQIDDGIEGIQDPKQREQWLNEFVTGNMTLSEQRKTQIEQANAQLMQEDRKNKLQMHNLEMNYKKEQLKNIQQYPKGTINTEDSFRLEQQLRGQFDGLSKDFVSIRNSYGKIKNSSKNPSPAGDLALIYNYMRMLDPTSTVREAEFTAAAQTGSYGEKIKASVNRITSGKRLTDDQRADFLNSSKQIYDEQKSNFDLMSKKYNDIAKSYNLDPERITSGYIIEDSGKEKSNGWIQGDGFKYRLKSKIPESNVVY